MLDQILRAVLFTPTLEGKMGLPILFWGKPGVGKSKIIKAVAHDLGLGCQTVIASMREPSDFLGIPVPAGDGAMDYAPPRWAKNLIKRPRSVLFLDEVSNAPPAVQSALMSVCHDRCLGDLDLPEEVRIVAAGNPVGQASAGWEMSPPLANRFGHLDWVDPSVAEWTDYILTHGGLSALKPPTHDAEELEQTVLEAWPAEYAQASGIVTAFMRRQPGLIHAMPDAGSPDRSRAWPSHRTWDIAIHALTGARIHGLDEPSTITLVSGYVGVGAAKELIAFMSNLDLPDPIKLLDTGAGWVHDKRRPDRTIAVLASCAAIVIPDTAEKRDERQTALWALLAPMVDHHIDLITPACRAMVAVKLYGCDNSRKVLGKAAPIFAAAGLNT